MPINNNSLISEFKNILYYRTKSNIIQEHRIITASKNKKIHISNKLITICNSKGRFQTVVTKPIICDIRGEGGLIKKFQEINE